MEPGQNTSRDGSPVDIVFLSPPSFRSTERKRRNKIASSGDALVTLSLQPRIRNTNISNNIQINRKIEYLPPIANESSLVGTLSVRRIKWRIKERRKKQSIRRRTRLGMSSTTDESSHGKTLYDSCRTKGKLKKGRLEHALRFVRDPVHRPES